MQPRRRGPAVGGTRRADQDHAHGRRRARFDERAPQRRDPLGAGANPAATLPQPGARSATAAVAITISSHRGPPELDASGAPYSCRTLASLAPNPSVLTRRAVLPG
jgi:hypothetical protein